MLLFILAAAFGSIGGLRFMGILHPFRTQVLLGLGLDPGGNHFKLLAENAGQQTGLRLLAHWVFCLGQPHILTSSHPHILKCLRI